MNGAFRQGSKTLSYSLLKIANANRETNKMIRYTLFVLTILGSAATAIASIAPADQYAITNPKAVSIVYMDSTTPMIDGVIVEKCAVEDCSDTPSNS